MRSLFVRILPLASLGMLLLSGCGKSIRTDALKPQVLLQPIHCVAVMPFENLTTYPRAGDIVSDFLATEIYSAKRFRLIDRMEIQQAARRINLRIPARISGEFARQMGERMGVDGVVFGSVSEYWYPNTAGTAMSEQVLKGDEPAVGINARLLAVDTGEVLWSASASRSSFDMFADQRDPLSRISQLAITDMLRPLFASVRERAINLLEPCGHPPAPLDGRFHGRVLDADSGEPVPQAAMMIREPQEARVEVQAQSGEYLSPPLPAGVAEYTVQAKDYEPAQGSIEILSNENISHDIRLSRRTRAPRAAESARPGIVGGRVLDPQGAALAALVRFDPDPGFAPLRTNKDTGRFRKEIMPGAYTAVVSAEGYKPREKAVRVASGQSFFMEITLDPVSIEPKQATLEKDRIVLTEQVHFVTGSAKLVESSYPVLLQVASILKDHPEIRKIQVEGHTDDQGGALLNQRLSQERSESVVQFLVQAGVEPVRLSALGFGEAVPIADNATPDGRARNRRVEFTVLERR